jgi:hypothetical protein
MFTDDENPQRLFDERLDREGGVFMEPDAKEIGCDPEELRCSPGDYANDPEPRETGIPGTVDDTPLDFGLEIPPADEHVVLEGAVESVGDSREATEGAEDMGSIDEKELWAAQDGLLEEDEADALVLDGFPEEVIPEILEAMGDDAADPLPDFPNGTSATGDWSATEHGGFPDRHE